MSKENTVWLVQTTDRNVVDCEKFGTPEVLLFRPTGVLKTDLEYVETRIPLVWKKGDYLNLVGHPLFVAVAFHALKKVIGTVPVLVWDKRFLTYEAHAV